MFRRKKKSAERLPWFRALGYKGNLTENERHELNSFRMRANHPAASYDSLPGEVKSYIIKLEMKVYDKKQEALALSCLVVSGLGGFFLVRYALGMMRVRY